MVFGFSGVLRAAAAAIVVVGGLIVASCAGGSVSSSPNGLATAVPQTTQIVPTGGGTLSLPATANGQSATVTVGAGAPAGTEITASSSTSAPGGAPAPSSALRRDAQSIPGAVPFYYVIFSVNQPLSAQLLEAETVSVLNTFPAGAAYYAEFDDITATPGTKLGCAGPATPSGQSVTVNNSVQSGACSSSGGNVTLEPGHKYVVQFYYVPSGSPTPSPSPTATATGSSQPQYTFSGFTDATNCTAGNSCLSAGGTANGVTFNATFNDANTTTVVTISGADYAEISPSGFPAYSGSGTAEIYVKVTASVAATFPQTPAILTFGNFGAASSCIFYGYENQGSGYAWTQIAPATGSTPIGSPFTNIAAVTEAGGIQVGPSPFYGALVCM